VSRIPFAITHKVAAAQLSRLSGLTKTIRHITALRLTNGHFSPITRWRKSKASTFEVTKDFFVTMLLIGHVLRNC
jgi:hypothetical protein